MKSLNLHTKILATMVAATLIGAFVPIKGLKWMGAFYSLTIVIPSFLASGRINFIKLLRQFLIVYITFFLLHKYIIIDNSISWWVVVLMFVDIVFIALIINKFFNKKITYFYGVLLIAIPKYLIFKQLGWFMFALPYLVPFIAASIFGIVVARWIHTK